MNNYKSLGFFDFEDFAEELVEEDLLSVNGGANYGQCGGEIKFIPPTGPTGPTYNPTNQDNDSKTTNNTQTRNYGDCGGNYVILDNGQRAMFMEQKTFSTHYHDYFGNQACAATLLLNELSELYTKETGKVLTTSQLTAANDMAKSLGLTGKFTYTTDSSNADIIIYAVDNTKKDKNGNKIPGTDGIVDHFVNDIGNGSKRCLKYSN